MSAVIKEMEEVLVNTVTEGDWKEEKRTKEDDWKEKLANTSNGLSPFEEPVLVEKDLERAELFAASHHFMSRVRLDG
jgi:hypothetical protein